MPYSSVENVKTATGVQPRDIGMGVDGESLPDVALDDWIEARLEEISNLIDRHIAEQYQGESAPAGVHGIATQMAANLIANVKASRTQSVVRISDWRVQIEQARVFTQDVKDALALYQQKNRINIFRVPGWREREASS